MSRAPRILVPLVTPFDREGEVDGFAVRRARRAEALGAEGILLAPIVPELYAGRSERDVLRFHEDVGVPRLPGQDLLPQEIAELERVLSRIP